MLALKATRYPVSTPAERDSGESHLNRLAKVPSIFDREALAKLCGYLGIEQILRRESSAVRVGAGDRVLIGSSYKRCLALYSSTGE